MKKQIFRIADCPKELVVLDWLKERTGYDDLAQKVTPQRDYPPLIELEGIAPSTESLETSIREAFDQYGRWGWLTPDGRTPGYGGISLAYNPNHTEGLDPHASSFGSANVGYEKLMVRDWTQDPDIVPMGKDSYDDSYGFRVRTPGSRVGALGELLDGFSRSLIRSRVAEIQCNERTADLAQIRYTDPKASLGGWHRDERVYENLRIQVPVTGSDNFRLEVVETENPEKVIVNDHLVPGKVYTFDTDLPHRGLARQFTDETRILIILGFSPWFDYLPDSDAWATNEFFGELHPFDMIHSGYVHPALRVANL